MRRRGADAYDGPVSWLQVAQTIPHFTIVSIVLRRFSGGGAYGIPGFTRHWFYFFFILIIRVCLCSY